MKVYHGSDSLSNGKIPTNPGTNGCFFTLDEENAQLYGDTVHAFEIDEDMIFDFRNTHHFKKIKNLHNWHQISQNIKFHENKLPLAYIDFSINPERLIDLKEMIISIGFKACYFYETGYVSVEVWDNNILKK